MTWVEKNGGGRGATSRSALEEECEVLRVGAAAGIVQVLVQTGNDQIFGKGFLITGGACKTSWYCETMIRLLHTLYTTPL